MSALANRSAIVTGGLSGIGLAIALALAEAGAKVAVGSTRAGDGAVQPIGTSHFSGSLDVRQHSSIDRFITAAALACGPADILINAAGIAAEQLVSGHSDELWDRMLDVNLTGAFRMTRAVLPGMMARKWGRIINIGSTAASVGWAGSAAYCASKAGLLGFTRCVALEGAPHGVACVMVSPTWVETDMMQNSLAGQVAREGKGRTVADAKAAIAAQNPQQRIIQPREIAALTAFLCQEVAGGITMENIQVTGGALW
jgi:3-hydroxybutyrate dehydrogenase